MNDGHWVETPMFLLRRGCLDYATIGWRAGRFLEIGAGTGRMTTGFLKRGFTGTCYDLGADNRDVLRRNLSPFGADVRVVDSLDEVESGSFDYVLAFEVLEHINADAEALRLWVRFLKPGGRVLLSVPAHMRKYDQEDRAVGHYRRYEREQLERLLQDAGCVGLRILSYGFPLATLTRRGNRCLSRWKTSEQEQTAQAPETLSIRSGIERSDASLQLARILNRHTLTPFIALQRLFFDSDLGDGYVADAVFGAASDMAVAS
ncbi:MAG: class I SAM-dependent methyltransferase [Dongiaceae bacterium]